MQTSTSKSTQLERSRPLLRTIQKEIDERLLQIASLEERLLAFEPTRRIHEEDIRQVQSELSTHRRELRNVEKELSRLGVAFDADNPSSIVESLAEPRVQRTSLGDTGFRHQVVDQRTT